LYSTFPWILLFQKGETTSCLNSSTPLEQTNVQKLLRSRRWRRSAQTSSNKVNWYTYRLKADGTQQLYIMNSTLNRGISDVTVLSFRTQVPFMLHVLQNLWASSHCNDFPSKIYIFKII
jgi:hypothetical protein